MYKSIFNQMFMEGNIGCVDSCAGSEADVGGHGESQHTGGDGGGGATGGVQAPGHHQTRAKV